eukprot:scaffold9956_cov62-Phaeocystis_antarctica.AAC.4
METILRSVFEAEAKAASASPAKVITKVAWPITKVVTLPPLVTFILVASVTFILVELCGTELGGSWGGTLERGLCESPGVAVLEPTALTLRLSEEATADGAEPQPTP